MFYRTNIKKKIEVSSTDSDEADESNIIIAAGKKKTHNPLVQSTSSFKKIRNNKRKDQDSDSSSEEDETLKRSKLFKVNYESTRNTEREGPNDMGATSTMQIDTEKDKDAQAQFEANKKIQDSLLEAEDVDNVYRGLNNYHKYVQKKDTPFGNASSNHARHGPMRAPENIRSTVRWDYQPDICKDYKETGFCGFGDSCKFLHDRSDYKAGWQLEQEVAAGPNCDDDDDDKYRIDDEDDDLPFKCLICRESFTKPVVTKCKHYFCEGCALKQFRKSTRCAACGQQTMGVFNIAKDIIKKLEKLAENQEEGEHKSCHSGDHHDHREEEDED